MREFDFERSRAKVMGLDRTAERPWRLLEPPERVAFRDMPPIPDQALITVIAAREALPLAESYRGFNVGACAMVRRKGNAIALSHGVNMKSSAGKAAVDFHAEESIVKSLRPGDEITSLALVGTPQEDHGSGLTAHTLHPCSYRCLPLMAESPQVSADALIFCSSTDGLRFEWGTVADFLRYHQGDTSGVTSVTFETFPAALQRPPKAEAHRLSSELDIDTSEWDAKVMFPLVEWHRSRF